MPVKISPPTTIRIPDKLLAAIDKLAVKQRSSRSMTIVNLLERAMEKKNG